MASTPGLRTSSKGVFRSHPTVHCNNRKPKSKKISLKKYYLTLWKRMASSLFAIPLRAVVSAVLKQNAKYAEVTALSVFPSSGLSSLRRYYWFLMHICKDCCASNGHRRLATCRGKAADLTAPSVGFWRKFSSLNTFEYMAEKLDSKKNRIGAVRNALKWRPDPWLLAPMGNDPRWGSLTAILDTTFAKHQCRWLVWLVETFKQRKSQLLLPFRIYIAMMTYGNLWTESWISLDAAVSVRQKQRNRIVEPLCSAQLFWACLAMNKSRGKGQAVAVSIGDALVLSSYCTSGEEFTSLHTVLLHDWFLELDC